MDSEQSKKIRIPQKALSFIGEGVPLPKRLLAAKGFLPFESEVIVTILYFLLADKDKVVKSTAKESLDKLPDKVLINAINSNKLHHSILNYIARIKINNDAIIESFLVSKNTENDIYSLIAKSCSSKMLDVITFDHARILAHPEIIDVIKTNPLVAPYQIEKVCSFLEVENVYSVGDKVIESQSTPEEESQEIDEEEIPEELIKEKDEIKDEKVAEVFKVESIENKIRKMKVPQKVKLAIVGNREVRRILLRDTNRMITTAVLQNRKITGSEIMEIVQSRTISEDILRTVMRSKDWMKNYSIKVALVQNPKTPIAESMRLMQQIRLYDLREMAHSKSIPVQISSLANRLYQEKIAKKDK